MKEAAAARRAAARLQSRRPHRGAGSKQFGRQRDAGKLGAPASRFYFGPAKFAANRAEARKNLEGEGGLHGVHMLGSVGMPELIVIFVIALMVFGPRKLPELGRAVGQAMNEFKKGLNNVRDTVEKEARQEQQKAAAENAAPQNAADTEDQRQIS